AKTSSLPEVCGNAAIYFDPDDIEALEKIMMLSIKSPSPLIGNIAIGEKQAASFTWQKTAKKTLDVYQNFRLHRGRKKK
ncbi:MAG: hypothetical protein ABH846_04865, partial [Patescibacteria group bacterium]